MQCSLFTLQYITIRILVLCYTHTKSRLGKIQTLKLVSYIFWMAVTRCPFSIVITCFDASGYFVVPLIEHYIDFFKLYLLACYFSLLIHRTSSVFATTVLFSITLVNTVWCFVLVILYYAFMIIFAHFIAICFTKVIKFTFR